MFKKKFPSLSSLGSDGNTSFLRAARAGHLDKVLEHLDKNNVDINTSNANGLNALHLASKDGHIHVVTELLKRGANVDSATKKGNTALHIASLAGQEEVVRLLVDHGASVNVQSQNGFTPLYMAAQENHDNVVKFLLASGANQSLATEDGFTPLAVAMQQGHDKVVAVLLENDSRGKVRLPALHIAAKKDDCKAAALLLQNEHNPDVTSKSGFTPLHIASHYGNEGIANLLLSKGADVNYSAKHNITPLHVAAKWGKSNMVSLLLEKGANIESKTRDGLTPLHCAARSGHEQVVDMLLERGAPISSKTKNGLAPLHMSSQGDHVDAARILLYHRAPVDEVTVDYLTALHVAAHCGHARVAKLLLDRKADPNARALNGFTPLHIACKKNRIKVVELLLKHGASIEATTESGLTPLHVASFMGCMNIVIYLLQNEANPDVPTVRGESPLHLAARANQTDIIRILLRNGAQVDARAREQQTPLHIAARLGNVDIVMLLLQHGAAVDSTTKDLYTALHIAAKEGQDEVASVLVENNASLTATTKKGFTPLHLAAKYGNMKVARLLLQRDAPVDAQGKNGVTPLHVASHYDHQNVALLLLDKGASPHATAKNGHTPLHIAAKKNQMDIATTLLEYGAKANSESRAGFTPLHLSAQEGHSDMSSLLIEHHADTNHKAKNGLTPLHLCAQEDRVEVAGILAKNGAEVDSTTKAGYTPLHVASHFGQLNMVRFLVQNKSNVGATTAVGYTPLHQAAQQGHSTIVNTLLENGAPPNVKTNQGQTALSIAQKLGYISVVETLKGVTEPSSITGVTMEEKYKVVSPETMQETFMSDSEDEGGEDTLLSEQPYRYLTVDEMKSLGDDSLPIDVTRDERFDSNRDNMTVPPTAVDDTISPQHIKESYSQFTTPDNVDISRHPLHVGFLVSFLVDARGGAMRGCRHSGVRVIVPPRRASMPMRVTCRYLKRDKLSHPPPLMEGEALASRILELGPVGAKFLGPVIIEVPHFGSLRGKEREIVILRSDNGETWREHTVEASEEAVHDVLSHSFDKEELVQMEDAGRTTRILTTDFPHYFAVVTRVRQEVHAIGPEGGMVSSSVVPQVQAVFPQGALTKKIKVGLQAQPIPAELAAKLLGNRVAVSPIVTVEPRRRKFHKPITLTIPVPQAANKGMINQYSGDAPTLRLLCSITGGTTRAQWEDVTGSTPLTFVNDCVSFTTTVSARFWLMDCRNIGDATKMATELYREAIHVPFMAKFVVFAKRIDVLEARLRVFCMTDDKEDKTLEHQEHFTEVAKSRDVEVLEGKPQYVEFAANLVPVTKSGEQLQLGFRAFRENRLPFTVRVKDPHAEPIGRTLFMKEPKVPKGEPPQQPICVLNIVLPEEIIPETGVPEQELHKYSFIKDSSGLESYQRADLRLSDISNLLGEDWVNLAEELSISTSDINRLKSECPGSVAQQGLAMLRFWLQQAGNKASANTLEAALTRIGREDIVQQCVYNVDQTGFDLLKEELGPSRDSSLRRNIVNIYDKDNMKEAEAAELRKVQERILPAETLEKDDKEERKYVAEEKEVEEVKKSVSERRKEIEQRLSQDREIVSEKKLEQRLSQEKKVVSEKIVSSVEKSKIIDDSSEKEIAEEKSLVIEDDGSEPSDLTFAEKRLSFEKGLRQEKLKPEEKYSDQMFIHEEQKASDIKEKIQVSEKDVEETKLTFAEKRKSFEQGLLEKEKEVEKVITSEVKTTIKDKVKKVESIETKEIDSKQSVSDDKFIADQRRDSELFEGVTETLGRLDKTGFTPQVQDLLSPMVSKTPPPSPAEFNKETTEAPSWQPPASQIIPEKTQTTTDWATKSSTLDSGKLDLVSDSIRHSSEIQQKSTKKEIDEIKQTKPSLTTISEQPKEELLPDDKKVKTQSNNVPDLSAQFIASESSNLFSNEDSSKAKISGQKSADIKKNPENKLQESPLDSSDSKDKIPSKNVENIPVSLEKGKIDEKLLSDSYDEVNKFPTDILVKAVTETNKESGIEEKYSVDSKLLQSKILADESYTDVTKTSDINVAISSPLDLPDTKTEISSLKSVKDVIVAVADVEFDRISQLDSSKSKAVSKTDDMHQTVSTEKISVKNLESVPVTKKDMKIKVVEKETKQIESFPVDKVVTKTEIIIEEKIDDIVKGTIDNEDNIVTQSASIDFAGQLLSGSCIVEKSQKKEVLSATEIPQTLLPGKIDESKSKSTNIIPEKETFEGKSNENKCIIKEVESTEMVKPVEDLIDKLSSFKTKEEDLKKTTKQTMNLGKDVTAEASEPLKIKEDLFAKEDGKLLLDQSTFVSKLKEGEPQMIKTVTKTEITIDEAKVHPPQQISFEQENFHVDKKSIESEIKPIKKSDQLTDILIDMLIEQETSRSPTSPNVGMISDQLSKLDLSEETFQSKELPQKIEKSHEKIQVEKESVASEKILLDSLKSVMDDKKVISQSKESFVAPEKSDRNFPFDKHALTGEEEVFSYVTTPTLQRRKIGGSQRLSREERPALMEVSHLRDESSEESDEEHYIVTEPPEKEKISGENQRKVQFRVESEEDPSWQADEQEGDIEFEELKDDGTKVTKHIKVSKYDEDGGKGNVVKEFVEETVYEFPGKDERKIRRVERRFERMASETLEADPVANVAAEGEFQRMVSQLSMEEVNECLQVWDEGGLTPSSELDSKDATEGDVEDDYEQLPQASAVSQFIENIDIFDDNEANFHQDIPSSVYWSFTDKPIRSSVIIPEDLALPLEQPGNLKVDTKLDSTANTSNLESPLPLLKINTLGQSYSFDSPENEKDVNFDTSREFIKHEGGQTGEESGSTTTELPGTRERDEIQSEQADAPEQSSATDKPSGSGGSGASPGPGLPPTKK